MIVVTGAAGFIGSNLLAALDERGESELVVCDVFGNEDKWRNIAGVEIAEFVTPDKLLAFLEANGNRVRMVYHLGAISSTTETDVDLIVSSNFNFSLDLWRWCTAWQVRLVYASSAATYGDGSLGFDDDNTLAALAKLKPLNAYGWSKHVFDRRAARSAALGGLKPPQWAGLKFFNVYGPNEYHKGSMKSVIAKSYPFAAKGEPVVLFKSHHPGYGDGGQLRDFVSVHDCVSVMLWLLDHPRVSGLFNVGTGKARSFADLVKAVFAAVDRPANIQYVDTPIEIRDKYQYFTEARMDRLRSVGYSKPFLSLEEGVADYVRNYLSQPDPYRCGKNVVPATSQPRAA